MIRASLTGGCKRAKYLSGKKLNGRLTVGLWRLTRKHQRLYLFEVRILWGIICSLAFAGVAAAQQRPVTGPDSVMAAISDLAEKVGAARSGLDQYRRSAYNDAEPDALNQARAYGSACRDLADAAKRDRTWFCRSCLEHRFQAAVDQYRAYLPTVEQFGRGCAARMNALKPSHGTTKINVGLRQSAEAETARIIHALGGYEVRLAAVRGAMPVPAPRS